MKGGYAGKMLFVDLKSRSIREQALDDKLARDYIGGPSLGARVLYDLMRPGVDPLGPENVLGFVTGPLTGSGAFFGSRYTVVCKSPVTGGFNDANSGGYFGSELKQAGFDSQTGEYVNLISKGIIDPTKVVRVAIQNAASVAALLITTEAMVAEVPKKNAGAGGMPPGGGGMGGMDF
jgi:hypothetical protein